MIRAVVPATVHAEPDGGGRLVLLDTATGHWYLLNRTGADFYRELREVGDIDAATEALISRHRDVPVGQIRQDVSDLVSALVGRGLIELEDHGGRHPAGLLMALPHDRDVVPIRWRILASAAFVGAIVLLRLPFRITAGTVVRLKRAKREATVAQARAAIGAARWAGRHYLGRVACLELSLTAVLAAAMHGVRMDLCFGFAVDPYSFHAWVEVGGEPIIHPADEPIPPTYRCVFRA
ncbi:MAG TPA: lasso peptide biosynthesis B2 protein [Pseudonocardiaceae bacterium]|nr:lasso peptide biosynthesis B2 protein [Pseudonocardiaceae bacterium]